MNRAFNCFNPFEYAAIAIEQQKLTFASAETVWRRSSMMASGSMSHSESMAMWFEKPTAVVKSMESAALAVVAGKAPLEIVQAAMKPVTAKASSNAKRLRR